MALKAVLAKLEDVAESLRSLYKAKDGKFVLDVDGMVTDDEHDAVNTKLTEFRDNNRKLHTENETLKATAAKFEGIDPTEVKTLREKVTGFERAGATKPDDIAAQIAAAVDKALTPINAKLEASEKEKAAANSALEQKNLEEALWKVGSDAGIAEDAKVDFLGRASGLWRWKDGKPVALKGDDPVYSKRKGKVTEQLTPEEWVVEWLPEDRGKHLFKPSGGSGTQNNNGSRNNGGPRIIANDMATIGSNLEALAKGEMTVRSA